MRFCISYNTDIVWYLQGHGRTGAIPNNHNGILQRSNGKKLLKWELIDCRPVLIVRKHIWNQNLVMMRVLQVFKRLDMFELEKGFSAQHRVNTSAVVFLIAVLCTLVIYLVLWSQGIMLVYDITNEKSFDNIKNWIRNIEEVSVSVPNLSSGFKASAVCSAFLIYIIIRSYLHFLCNKRL